MRLVSLHTYPVKGCHRLDHEVAQVQPWGLAGDRRWLVVDWDDRQVTQRETPRLGQIQPLPVADGLVLRTDGMPDLAVPEPRGGERVEVGIWRDRVEATLAGPAADEWLGEVLGSKVRLVWLDDPTRRPVNPARARADDRVSFADGYPLLLTSTASLDAVNGWLLESGSLEGPLPMTRFRPNVVVSGVPAWQEDEWVGRRVRIGARTLRVASTCGRCVVTTTDQETGERGYEPLRVLARHRRVDGRVLFGVNLIPDDTGPLAVGDPVEPLADEV